MARPPNIPKRKVLASPRGAQSNFQSDQLLQVGFKYYQIGDFTEAKKICLQILSAQPTHFSALQLQGALLIKTRDFTQALDIFSKALAINPNDANVYGNQGVVLKELKQWDAALASYDRAIELKPDFADAYYNRANIFKELKLWDAALASYDRAIELRPTYADAFNNRANTFKELKQWDAALASYDNAIALRPNFPDAYNNRGISFQMQGNWDDALSNFNKAIELRPEFASAHINRGIILHELKQWEAALISFERAVTLIPHLPDAHIHRGRVLQELRQWDAALASYDKAIELKPELAEAYYNRANIFKELEQWDMALENYDKAIQLKPELAEAYSNRGNVLQELKQWDAALGSYDRALEFRSDYAGAHNNRANVLKELKQWDAALVSYDKAIEHDSDFVFAHNNRGALLHILKKWDDAIASYHKAVALNPAYADAYSNLGASFQELKIFDKAIDSYQKSFSINPDLKFLHGALQYAKMHICDWSEFDAQIELLSKKIITKAKVATPFSVLALVDSSPVHHTCAKIFCKEQFPVDMSLGAIANRGRSKKIRIGYYSADFRYHAISFLTAELFELHNKDQFELVGFSFGPDDGSVIRSRISQAFDQFIDVSKMSDREIAQLSRKMGIDIAVDLAGYTIDSRTNIFAYRAAPIQVNYLGYPGTMGAPYIDYIVADSTLLRVDEAQHYSEKIVFLPDTYQANDRKRAISDKAFTRGELGLPENVFVFCCFNNNFKITPDTFASWMRILRKAQGSVLWLFEDNHWASENLRLHAQQQGVDANRLIFASRMTLSEHLARYPFADLFIDTLPYNAHTTASDALWTGLPVLTLIGQSFASRVAASLLRAIDLPELITHTREEYEALAIELATQPHKLAAIKQKLSENRLTTPLFDTPRFTKHLEAAYTQMMERYWADLPPEHIDVRI